MTLKKFKVHVMRRAYQNAVLTIEATSPAKARAIAEYKANQDAHNIDWDVKVDELPLRITSRIVDTEVKG